LFQLKLKTSNHLQSCQLVALEIDQGLGERSSVVPKRKATDQRRPLIF
jgi:hypothetical protein